MMVHSCLPAWACSPVGETTRACLNIVTLTQEVVQFTSLCDVHLVLDNLCLQLQGKIAKWWIPDDVAFVKEIPHTATGKVYKLKLRQQFKDFRLGSSKL